MFDGATSLYVVYAAAALCGIILAEAGYLLLAQNADKRDAINRRMKIAKQELTQRDVLVQLRKERGMEDGRFAWLSF